MFFHVLFEQHIFWENFRTNLTWVFLGINSMRTEFMTLEINIIRKFPIAISSWTLKQRLKRAPLMQFLNLFTCKKK